jgi:hypothetical protein
MKMAKMESRLSEKKYKNMNGSGRKVDGRSPAVEREECDDEWKLKPGSHDVTFPGNASIFFNHVLQSIDDGSKCNKNRMNE